MVAGDGFVAVDELVAAGGESQLTGLRDVDELFACGLVAVGRLRGLAHGVRAENVVRGPDQQGLPPGRWVVIITDHVPCGWSSS